jgi:hypothetical protein
MYGTQLRVLIALDGKYFRAKAGIIFYNRVSHDLQKTFKLQL